MARVNSLCKNKFGLVIDIYIYTEPNQ